MASLCARSGARRMWEAERYKTPSSSNRMKIKALRLGPKRLLHGIISCRSAGLGADVGPGQGLGLTTQYKGERPCVLLNATPERGPSPLFQPPPSPPHTRTHAWRSISARCARSAATQSASQQVTHTLSYGHIVRVNKKSVRFQPWQSGGRISHNLVLPSCAIRFVPKKDGARDTRRCSVGRHSRSAAKNTDTLD